ncbi:TrlF family AAA-like ATPase [Bradyrhizobium sp. 5.13L]
MDALVEDAATGNDPFANGTEWVRADFHLHTKADKEFKYGGADNAFAEAYFQKLKSAGIRLGVITNHNKFNVDEFKALRKRARKAGIGLLPGVELSVNDGANGVHTLVVFSEAWLEAGHDYINPFLTTAFAGKVPAQYEQENGRSNDDLLATLRKLKEFNRDFFVVFAHVEGASGLWREIDGGRMQELAQEPLIQQYCLGFQKVRTHDKPGEKCRLTVRQWWKNGYPAELEGSDPKTLDEIGKGPSCYLKIGDFTFDSVRFALTDFKYRVATRIPQVKHSHVNAIRFEGGLLDGVRIPFSPNLNCLIGIQGSGKSSVLECLRYTLGIPFGEKVQDPDYKNELVPHVLKSGGKVIVEATDRHGARYEISRILNHQPDVYVEGKPRPGIAIRETIICKPLYFGQKDLSAAGKGFGQDLVEKLIGHGLKDIRQKIALTQSALDSAANDLQAVQGEVDDKRTAEDQLKDVNFRLEQFDKHGVKDKLEKQVSFNEDEQFCADVEDAAQSWHESLDAAIDEAEETIKDLTVPGSKHNEPFFKKYKPKLDALKTTVADARKISTSLEAVKAQLRALGAELTTVKDGLKDEFAEVERKLVKLLAEQGVTSIQPNDYVALVDRKKGLAAKIADLEKKTTKEAGKRDAVLKAVTRLNDAWLDEFKQLSTELGKINKAQGALQVQTIFKGDKAAFRDKLEETFRGHNIRKETYQTLAEQYPDFAHIYRDLGTAAAHAKGKSDIFKELFLENLAGLLTYQVPNSYDVTYHGKPLKSHSLGQRASAMMLFLLSQDDNDLLMIDQPEDDLDSQTVYEEVVKLLRDLKIEQQFIFATHNANFPVLGDAEIVAACSMNDEAISVSAGSIDTKAAQKRIVDIMEGGVEAFERRKVIYHIWHAG